MASDGLLYLGSWVEASLGRVFQLTECDDPRRDQAWVARWGDLVDCKIVPVVSSRETAAVLRRLL